MKLIKKELKNLLDEQIKELLKKSALTLLERIPRFNVQKIEFK